MKKRIAIVQSNYIPWKGYFDLINMVDEFILLDEVQYTRRDWRNRNKIKTPSGPAWLSIPVEVKGRYQQKISETLVSDSTWPRQHWNSLLHCYAQAAYFKHYQEQFALLYLNCHERKLSDVNLRFLRAICDILNIKTTISWSSDYDLTDGINQRLIDLCRQAGATRYLSGPTAQNYLDETAFAEAGIEVAYMDYAGYREYKQLFPPFTHEVSVLDLIFNEGPESCRFMKSFSQNA